MPGTDLPIQLPRKTFYGWVIVAVAFLVNLAGSPMNPVTMSIFVIPMTTEMDWALSDIAWAMSLRMIVGGIAGPLMGPLVDKYGTRWLGALTGILSGATTIALFWVHDLWAFYLLFGLSGLSGFGGPVGAILTGVPVAKWFTVRRGRAMAITGAGVAVGTAIAIPVGQLLIDTIGWRSAWLLFGVIMWVTIVPAYAIFMRREPEDHDLVADGGEQPVGSDPRVEVEPHSWTLREAVTTPVLWLILIGQLSLGFNASGTLLYRVGFFQQEGLATGIVAIGTMMDPVIVIFTALLFGFLAERFVIRYIGVIGALGWSGSILPLLFFVRGSIPLLFLHNIVWAIGSGAGMNFQNLVWPDYFGRRYLGSIRGLMLPLGIAAGALGTPLYAYIIGDGDGYRTAWLIAFICMVIPVILYSVATRPTWKLDQIDSTATSQG